MKYAIEQILSKKQLFIPLPPTYLPFNLISSSSNLPNETLPILLIIRVKIRNK